MYRKILVPLDGSKFAESALEHAREIARASSVEKLILLRILEPLIVDVKDFIGAECVREAEEKRETNARKYLKDTAAKLKKDNISVETKLVVDGEPAEKILEIATEEKVDLITMSTHGRSGFQQWVFGSVAHRVLVHSSIPILMVVPGGERKNG
jgi:nucleotide-binding universal stress UspA family protein